jgi:cytochrome c-type biogenesis protein CcmH/NrfG
VQEEAGNLAEAVAIYERMLAESEEDSMQRSVVQMRLTEVRARASASGS